MAKIYRKRGNKLNEVVTFDSACTRQENQPLVYDATDGSVHTTTHIGCLNADDVSVGNLTVTGQAIIQEQVTDTIDSNTLVLRSNADAGLTGTENSGVIIHNYNGSEDLYAVTDNTGTFRVGTAVSTTTTYPYLRYNETDNKWYSTAPGVTPVVEVTPVGSPTSWDSVVTSGDDVEYTNIVFSVIDRTSLEPLTTRDESTDMEADYLTKWNATDEKVVTTGTSCTHDLCTNGNITITCNACINNNITVDCNACISGTETVTGEIHSCTCVTAPTACISDDLYVSGDINNCCANSVIHGYHGYYDGNVTIAGSLTADTLIIPSITSDCVKTVENTANCTFYPSFVQNNHVVAGANELYTDGNLQYNPNTNILSTDTFCSDRGIVQSAISGVTAADLGLTANTSYSLSTIVSCLQACCGNKAVSYTFKYENASNPNVLEYGGAAYNLTFEKLDNNDLSGTWSKSRWLVTGENGVSWTVAGTTGATAGSITWTVREHVVDQVCVASASNNQDFPIIFSTCQSTPSSYFKKTLYNDSANQLMYNPSTNTLKTCCVCACCDSYHARIVTPAGCTCYAKITLNPDSLGENTAHLTFDVYGTKFELGVREIASSSTGMSISYFTKTGDYGITCANVTTANSRDIVYIKYSGYRPINITSDIPIKSITKSSTVPSDVCSTHWCTPTYDNATQYVNVTSTNCDYPILFNSCQATPAAGCKTLYNDSANNLMYNPSTNTLTTANACININACVGNNFQVGAAVGCTSSVTGISGFKIYGQGGGMDIYSSAPYLNFHVYNASSNSHCLVADYGQVKLTTTNGYGNTAATQSAAYYFCSDGTFSAPSLKINSGTTTSSLFTIQGYTSCDLSVGPTLKFSNVNANQNACFIFTDYDSYLSGAAVTLAGDQGSTWFCSQYGKFNTTVTCNLRLYHPAANTDWKALACVSFGSECTGGATHCPFLLAACPDANGINIAFGQNAQTIIYAGESAASNFANFITQNGSGEKVVLASDSYAADIVVNVNGGITCAYKYCFTPNQIRTLKWNTTLSTPAYSTCGRLVMDNCIAILESGGIENSINTTCAFVIGNANTVKANKAYVFGCGNTTGYPGTSSTNVIMIGTGNDLSYNGITKCNAIAIGFCNYDCQTSRGSSIAIGNCNINNGDGGISIGWGGRAANCAITIGVFSSNNKYYTSADSAIRIGLSTATSVTGTSSIAIGTNASACGTYSVAMGFNAKANSNDAIVIGDSACTSVNGDAAVVIGQEACGLGAEAIAIGNNACSCTNAVAIGLNTYSVEDSTAIGFSARVGGHGFLALGKCANSYVCQNVSDIYFRFPYSTTIEIDDPLYGRHGHIKFVIPSCSQNRDITNFLNCLFVREINMGRCTCTWSASSCCYIPTLVAHLSGFYWDDGGSSNRYQRWAPGINGRGNINELILLNTSAGAGSNLSVCDLIVNCGKNICTTSWNWGTGTSVWTCGMVGTIEF